jgi:hypothetical protein
MRSLNLITRFLLASALLLTIASCERHPGCTDVNATNYNVNAQVDNGTCLYDVTFYFDENGPNATVNINNQTGTVSKNYQSAAPTCGVNAAGCANFTLPVGSYAYSATSNFTTWSGGTVVVDGSGCQDVLLAQSTGSAIFWTASNTYGNILVTFNGGQGNITSFVTGGTPACGFTGCATFDVPPGTYAYTATAQNGANWSGNVTISADVCSAIVF